MLIIKLLLFAPLMALPSLNHWYVKVPVTSFSVAVNVILSGVFDKNTKPPFEIISTRLVFETMEAIFIPPIVPPVA